MSYGSPASSASFFGVVAIMFFSMIEYVKATGAGTAIKGFLVKSKLGLP
jgi:hypothetical protein